LVVGSDTIVSIDNEQLAKPYDIDEAKQMLQRMSGRGSIVTTSVVVASRVKGIMLCGAEETRVVFKPYNPQTVDAYLATGDYADKAGGYGIQSGAAPLIDHIEGDYDTIVGLPTRLLAIFLNQCGITAHQVQLDVPVRQAALVEHIDG
jgi:septum formation protein